MAPGPAVSYRRSERRASSTATPPGFRGAGAHGYPGMLDRLLLGAWPSCRPCAKCSPPKSSAAYLRLQWARFSHWCPPPLRRFGLALVPRLPVLGGFPAVMPRFALSCVLAQTAATPRHRPPGSGLFCRKTGPILTPLRGSGRLFRFLAAIRVDGYGIAPGQKHSHRWCPVPQPTKPPRTLLVR